MTAKPFLHEDMDIGDLKKVLDTASLSESDHAKFIAVLDTLFFITQELEKKRTSLGRLRKMLFGDTTEKTRKVLEKVKAANPDTQAVEPKDKSENDMQSKREKPKGHGRNGVSEYKGAKVVHVPHGSLNPKDGCPNCIEGKVYPYLSERIVRLTGGAPISATIYFMEKLRCNLCGMIFTAQAPEDANNEKYDANAKSMIAVMKYGAGMPFNRLEQLERNLGIPLASSTQWDIVKGDAEKITPVFNEMVFQAAQGDVLYNDDTIMKILELINANTIHIQDGISGRKGMFTSGIVSQSGDRKIVLFFTGRNHAGENIVEVLKHRLAGLPPPIQMCDALSRNMPKELNTIVANCLAHGRRHFVDAVESFPDEVLHVLKILKEVYINDDITRARGMTPAERLEFHQQNSKTYMDDLKQWFEDQFEERKVEPNSSLGEAITYMLKHWNEFTLFLREPGAPLDNNICERALKKSILHRKNSYFYKTLKGAFVGDLFMSLIHTCELCKTNPFNYLVELQKHVAELVYPVKQSAS